MKYVYSLLGAFIGYPGVFGGGFGTIYSSLNSTDPASSCTHASDVGVFCPEPSPTNCRTGQVRLSGSTEENEGRLEICVNNQWGTVCDDSWDMAGASIVCQQLSKSGKYIQYSNSIPRTPCIGKFSFLECYFYFLFFPCVACLTYCIVHHFIPV